MPNGDKFQTPASLYIDCHYNNLEILERWTWTRYCKICSLVRMTPYEMASLVCLPHSQVANFRELGRLPDNWFARPVALLLTIMEGHLLRELHHDIIRNPFPDLNKAI